MASRLPRVTLASLRPSPGSQHSVSYPPVFPPYSAQLSYSKNGLAVVKVRVMVVRPAAVTTAKNLGQAQVLGKASRVVNRQSLRYFLNVALLTQMGELTRLLTLTGYNTG